MLRFTRSFSVFLVFILVVSPVAFPVEASDTQHQTFKKLNLTTWVPVNWNFLQSGPQVILYPEVSASSKFDYVAQPDKISIAVTNYSVLETSGLSIVQKNIYEQAKDVNSWLNDLETYFSHIGLKIERIEDEDIGTVFYHVAEDISLNSYFEKDGQAMSVSLIATGSYTDLTVLKETSIYEDFQRVVKELRPDNGAGEKMKIAMDAAGDGGVVSILATGTDNIELGAYHCHGAECGYDLRVYRSIDYSPSGANYSITRFYNYLWYRHSNIRPNYLFRAALTNSSGCEGPDLANRIITKSTHPANLYANDSWSPNITVSPSTVALTTVGDLAISYCLNHWKPLD